MPSYLLSEWIAYYKMEPFGEERSDLRSAIVAATIANVNRGKNDQPKKVEDFMPKFEQDQEQNIEATIAFAAQLTASLGGTVKHG